MNSNSFGGNSMVGQLTRVAMTRPGKALKQADPTSWHYGPGFNPEAVDTNHAGLVEIVKSSGATIEWTNSDLIDAAGLADAVFAYDPSFMTNEGAIILRMGKPLRLDEAPVHRELYDRLDIPIIGTIDEPGRVEGGDCFWLDSSTLAVGRGFRTNQDGINQLAEILSPQGVEVLAYDLPYFSGPEACLHLMSIVSPISENKALVYAPLLPTALYQDMVSRGIEPVEAPVEEFTASNGLSLNVLALAPDDVAMISGFDATAETLRATGTRVQTFDGSALCIPCEGGPTCLTRTLHRLC